MLWPTFVWKQNTGHISAIMPQNLELSPVILINSRSIYTNIKPRGTIVKAKFIHITLDEYHLKANPIEIYN